MLNKIFKSLGTEVKISLLSGEIYLRWRNKQGDYFKAPLRLVLKYGKKRIQYEVNMNY